MSVDYDAHYGIGYEVRVTYEIKEHEDLDDGLNEYLYGKLSAGFGSFIVGNTYSGDIERIFIIIENALSNGLDLTEKKQALDDEIKRLKLQSVGKFDCVGGLYIC